MLEVSRSRKYALIVAGFAMMQSSDSIAQNNAIQQYNQFKELVHKDYADFRKKCNHEYAEFLRKAWESYEMGPIIPKPKDETVPPVVMPEEAIDLPIKSNPVPIDSIVTPVLEDPNPQPLPVAPIYEQDKQTENYITFSFFGTEGKVRMPKEKPNTMVRLENDLSGNNLAEVWEELSNGDFDNLMRDCLELRIRHSLCDWAYLLMLRELSERYYGRGNAATLFASWIFCQSGYQMRLAEQDNKLLLLFGTQHHLFDMPYYNIDGGLFYPLLHEGETITGQVRGCSSAFPEEQPMSLFLPKAQEFAESYGNVRTVRSERYPNVSASFKINQNLMKFYDSYPTSILGENFMTRWAMYANTPIAKNLKEQLYPQLYSFISGKSQLEAANILLNWVQTGFEYEYDDVVWGGDRAFFPEESLNYPYCDCEDRSILFTRLVRDLLGLECILVFYPGHLACAVNFTEQVNGDYIIIDNKRFVISDPTYIGAPVGHTMPDMDNKTASVILIDK